MSIALDSRLLAPRFTLEDAERAAEQWGFNCGPAALAMIAGKTPDEIRPFMGDFESKGYTDPTLMFQAMQNAGVRWSSISTLTRHAADPVQWPEFGLARVQWEGPWTAPNVPIRARYRHTHWVGCESFGSDWKVPGWEEPKIFDVNCMCVGGWVPLSQWRDSVVPWLLKQCEPKASGAWHLTHSIEVIRSGK